MSAGNFVTARYGASYDPAELHPIRVQPETLLASAEAPTGAVVNAGLTAPLTSPISAQVTKSTRSLGLHARLVTLKIQGTPPPGYLAGTTVRIPALTPVFFNACKIDTVVTYLGTSWKVVGTRAEKTR